MERPRFYGFIGCMVFLLLNIRVSLAQNIIKPSPDPSGNYYSNEASLKGTAPAPLMAGSLWKVVANSLNCRQQPGISHPIIKRFKKGNIIQAEVGRGGSDEVLLNALDNKGQPWMFVRGGKNPRNSPSLNCYVRANQLYIRPEN
ncbi:MAG: hypothetical protein VKJ46_10155 [Leptolyngbyaceae bacterium]|nr:hypothetical protein [Leptolyngbyaceae bacterium]